ncbi:hypothetical protein [Niabella aquatica]
MTETLIPKEEISHLTLIPAEENRTGYWKEKLEYAQRLGNEFKSKTSITFNTAEGPRTVHTTVWSLTEHYIVLKAGVLIPLNSIVDVHF